MPLQGSLDNRYEVGKSLGRGGMAEVYMARDRVLERDVALKILSRCYAEDGEFVRRFRREARSAASLTHPNVVSIHDLGEVEGEDGEPPTYYIAMEYVEGISLRDLLDQECRLRVCSPSKSRPKASWTTFSAASGRCRFLMPR